MDQRENWTWRRHQLYAHDPSWEEKAFAEDSAGRLLGGCVWPPRSYSCSFCRREFRSAQALGGHMNVHRRDRARLKQSVEEGGVPADHAVALLNPDHHRPYLRASEASAVATARDFISLSQARDTTPAASSFLDSAAARKRIADGEESFRAKKWRTEELASNDHEVLKLLKPPRPVEELDLELRLGQNNKPVVIV
ncbi:zinc finger protein 11-like [Zingiber officinale]|uniref:C2H2-type domain-containing protein n=1 Tax=Zingiber officinale TaxID=94328 RepID=A0A8J5M092_ZINOF|nr:zinc finger protein 11-like [Zingiber officinale]KAG6539011.1 hypothetical protein ZIOFF_004163 [Zingiber officinale]